MVLMGKVAAAFPVWKHAVQAPGEPQYEEEMTVSVQTIRMRLGVSAFAALMMTASAASADDTGAIKDGPYAFVYGGAALGNEVDVDIDGPGGFFDADLDDEWTVGAAVGYRRLFNGIGPIRAELDVNYQPVDSDSDLWSIYGNAWYDIETGGLITPYFGGGLGFGILDPEGLDTETGLAYQAGGGLLFDIGPSSFAGLNYRYYGFDTEINNADVDITGHRVTASIGINFGATRY